MAHRFVSFFSRSILGRLTLLIAATLVPAAMLVGWLIYQGYQNERRALERHLVGASRATSLLVDARLAERQALLEGLATSSRLRSGDLEAFRDQARSALLSPNEWIVVIDAEGQQLVNTLLPVGATLPKVAFRPEFREAALGGRSYVSNLTLGPASQQHVLFIAIPVFYAGKLRYTLNLAFAPTVLDQALGQGGIGREWVAAIVDRDGIVAARTRRPEQFIGVKATGTFAEARARQPEGLIQSVTLEGIKSITAYTRSARTGWSIAIAAPEAELFASAERLLMVALMVSLLLGAGAAIVALWVGRGVVGAVRTLVADTEAIGRGEALGPGDTGIEETDFVFRALHETSSRLAARDSELKRLNETLTTAANNLRERQERLDAARTAASTGTFVCHVATGEFDSDDSLNALFALPAGETVGSLETFLALVDEADRPRVRDVLAHCTRNLTELVIEFRIRRSDGASRWLFSKGRAFPGAGAEARGAYVAAACVDVTERKTNEAEIARVRDTAVAAARAKDEFLAALSHELRTPLNPVLLAASDGAARAEYPDAARETFAMIAKNARLEARLIDDLLDLTRIAQGKLSLDLEPVDAHAVLREAIANTQAELDEKRHGVELKLARDNALVLADPTRLQQVFWNVLKNAVKFTQAYGRITISTRTAGDFFEVEVADNGIGMTPAEIARSFQPFSQGDHATQGAAHRFGGLGLGLAISRVLVELHSGQIEARSAGRDHGSTFVIRIPLAPITAAPSPPVALTNASPAHNGEGCRILLVEDHEPTRVTLGRLLKRRNYHVETAATAEEALDLARAQKFDLVVSDIGLPDTDGFGLMKQLRATYALPGIALTGYGMEQDVERSREAGFLAHLTKPVDIHKLEAILVRVRSANHLS